MKPAHAFPTVDSVLQSLADQRYIADRSLATVVYLACHMEKPIFLEGEPGVGKTELALALSAVLDTRLIRLQCYEGLDAATALYEWNYPKQILRIKMEEQCRRDPDEIGDIIYTEPFLIKRPLLEAIQTAAERAPVLLIDELDQADEAFEAFLLEVLSDFQISIPEIGTLKATHIPVVVITSNRTREVHDAVKRRCLFHWIDYPDPQKEMSILRRRIPGIEAGLAEQIVRCMQAMRREDFIKKPGVSETLDWARALIALNRDVIDAEAIDQTLGCILKHRADLARFTSTLTADPAFKGRVLNPPPRSAERRDR